MTWIVKDWDSVFEDRVSRQIQNVRYARLPLERESEAFMDLMQTAKGREAYGAFCALLRVAARCKVRGRMEDDRGPLTLERLAARTHIPAKSLKASIEILTSKEVGWLVEDTGSTSGLRAGADGRCSRTAHERRPGPHQEINLGADSAQFRIGNEENERKKQQQSIPEPNPEAPALPDARETAAAEVHSCLKNAGIGEPELGRLSRSGITIDSAEATIRTWRATGKGVGVLVLDLRAEAERCAIAANEAAALQAFRQLAPERQASLCDQFRRVQGPGWAHVQDAHIARGPKRFCLWLLNRQPAELIAS
ncbi:MAG: hypothetical protein KF805_12300 [Phycisphaeraceae bacterium]|nr:hypothetical protein [Phycisphaeraceae bacterium]